MTKNADRRGARVQVYLDNPKLLAALKRSARRERVSLSRAAAKAIQYGLLPPEAAGEIDREELARALGAHARRTTRDFAIVQELVVELARALFLRLPDTPRDDDPLIQAAAQVRIERMLNAAAGKIVAGGSLNSFRTEPLCSSLEGGVEPASLEAAP